MALQYIQDSSEATKGEANKTPALDAAQSKDSGTNETLKTPVVTGVKDNSLSSNVVSLLITDQQEVAEYTYIGPLSIAQRHYLEQIANDPAYAKQQAEMLGTGYELVWAGHELPTEANGYTVDQRNAFLEQSKSSMFKMEQVRGERTAYYEKLKGEGMLPAEIFSKLLEFNANLPKSHDEALGWSKSGQSMPYSDYHQAKVQYLESLNNQA